MYSVLYLIVQKIIQYNIYTTTNTTNNKTNNNNANIFNLFAVCRHSKTLYKHGIHQINHMKDNKWKKNSKKKNTSVNY